VVEAIKRPEDFEKLLKYHPDREVPVSDSFGTPLVTPSLAGIPRVIIFFFAQPGLVGRIQPESDPSLHIVPLSHVGRVSEQLGSKQLANRQRRV
jgi:hypothetical protein